MRVNLSVEYNRICNNYLQAFCERHEFDLGEWETIGDHAEINGDFVAFDVIKYDVDYKVPVGTYERYVNYIANADGFINYPSYISMYGAEIDKHDKERQQIKRACINLKIAYDTLTSDTRKAYVVLIRHCFAYYFRKQGMYLQNIAELLGRTNHATIINSIEQAEHLISVKNKRAVNILKVIENA